MSDRPNNAFLRSLSDTAFEALVPDLASEKLKLGEPLYQVDDRVTSVYFPVDCLISVLTTSLSGQTVETAMCGNEGAVGVLEALGSGVTATVMLAQVDGLALKAPAEAFRRIAYAQPDLLMAAMRLVEVQMTESRQSGMCQALHSVEPRLARWLLESMDRCGGRRTMPLTQEFIASMLGVQRTTVTMFAAELQKTGLIRYVRGRVELVDPEGLEHRACECRDTIREQRRRQGLDPLVVTPDAGIRLVSG